MPEHPGGQVGVIVMAYGTPRTPEDIEPYYTHIRHGRPPSADLLAQLHDRYQAIGGRSPLLEITEAHSRVLLSRALARLAMLAVRKE